MLFKYKNNIAIHAPTRCGSTSMAVYLGFDPDKEDIPESEIIFPSADCKYNVLVLRNPYARLQSAISYSDHVAHSNSEKIPYGDYGTYVEWVLSHSNLFFNRLRKTANPRFYYIDFNRLGEYVPRSKSTKSFYIEDEGWKDKYSEFFSKEQLQQEYGGYCHIKENWRELEPHTWRVLTKSLSNVKVTALK